jgi:glycosyltransferase involved in cell wall biosynthesis
MKKLLFFVTEDWYFVSHRLSLALAAQTNGYEVIVVTRCRKHQQLLNNAGFTVISFETRRQSLNPFTLLAEAVRLAQLYKTIKPTVVHHVALRPVIVGAIAARLAGVNHVISAITGMGFLFVSDKQASIARRLLSWLFPKLLNGALVIVQNADDKNLLVDSGLDPIKVRLIPGSGVDTEHFIPSMLTHNAAPLVIMMAARLLWDKGVGEFVAAARLLQSPQLRFVLVGQPDPDNPATVSMKDLHGWIAEGLVEHWGHQNDMRTVLQKADVVCLPSYREGLPKILLEAMSCGLPCITTDVPGCRAAVRHDENGLLVPVKDVGELAAAITALAQQPETRLRMGRKGRTMALNEFDQKHIIRATLKTYEDILST